MFSEKELVAHQKKLLGYALKLTHNMANAQDLLQDTLLRAWQYRDSFDPGTNLNAWLMRIMRNCFYSVCVSKWNKLVTQLDEEKIRDMRTEPSNPHHTLEATEMVEFLFGGQMTDLEREAILMIGFEGKQYDEAAEELGIKEGTMKSRVNRARIKLADCLEGLPEAA